ncbi:magnesium transporter NIPA-domain-containing protein [Microdochium bolleyi]|uniref:Magnesium transporter NIPA-domain-containing protein n=1 Tax=Microdochium bolleyi TaxID=196109 RepID=A0A136J9Z4_9PEZI|nr:magnesium transporter NIPA-domain-containing protein [Microdochium bolleyi]
MGTLGDLSPAGSLAIGIIVGLISTSVQSLGLTLQRKSHLLEDEKSPHDVKRPPYRRRRWQLGMGMFIISNVVGSSIQISTLPLPVLSTLQAAGLVFNSICASLILGEPFTRWSFWGTALVTTGAALIAIFGATPSPAHTLRELIALLGRWQFLVWMSLQALLVISVAVATELLSHFSTLSQSPNFRLARGLAYGFVSGTLSAHSLLFAKSAVELILRTISDGDNQFVHWESWMLVILLVTLALSQLYYLHRGLKLVSTSVLYPLVFCIYNIIAILDGLIYFKQTDLITPLHGGLIAVGTVILLAGVLALSWRLNDEQHQPAVGQSTLTPGLGLVEDTDGEETDSLLDSDTISDDGNQVPSTYNTFGPSSDNTPLTPSRKSTNPWLERSEIWGELEDQDAASPPLTRRRSSTLPSGPASESTSLLPPQQRRLVSGESAASTSDTAPRRMFRKRRKSTGFPGFHARRSVRSTSTTSVQDALGGIWKMKWWRSGNRPRVESAASDTGAQVPWAPGTIHRPPPPGEHEWAESESSGGRRPGQQQLLQQQPSGSDDRV